MGRLPCGDVVAVGFQPSAPTLKHGAVEPGRAGAVEEVLRVGEGISLGWQ